MGNRMPVRIAILSTLLFGAVLVGLATGFFNFSLGSIVAWGALALLSLALLSRWFADAWLIGAALSWIYTVLLVIWLARMIL